MTDATLQVLPIRDLHQRHFISEATAAYFLEAASVCLSRHHESPSTFRVTQIGAPAETQYLVEWDAPDDRVTASHDSVRVATENGAYCIAIATAEVTLDRMTVHRADVPTGADWFLAEEGAQDLEAAMRLEVSGVDQDRESELTARLREKADQTKQGVSDLPAVAIVVGFPLRRVLVQVVEDGS